MGSGVEAGFLALVQDLVGREVDDTLAGLLQHVRASLAQQAVAEAGGGLG